MAEKECSVYSPILHKYYPEAQGVALIFLHMLYGKQLVSPTPFPAVICLFLDSGDFHLRIVLLLVTRNYSWKGQIIWKTQKGYWQHRIILSSL